VLDARVLLMDTLDRDELFLIMNREESLEDATRQSFMEKVRMRKEGMPVAYITGKKEFMGFTFKVTKDTLIPRADTEILVEKALEVIRKRGYRKILDLCSGSGAIGLSLAKILDFTNVTLSDIKEEAISVSRENAQALGIMDRVDFTVSDLFRDIHGRFDMIASNPPYISREEMGELSATVKDFEPHTALFGGEDGLDFYREIAEKAREFLAEDGALIFEIGYDQGGEVMEIMKKNGYRNVEILKDLAGLQRVVFGELIPET
jgi:release factor glutamine methyltransferase